MMLQVCPNGPHGRSAHPQLPTGIADVVTSVGAAIGAGAAAVHVHPKDARGRDSLRPRDVDPLVQALHATFPGVPVGVTTGAWATPNHRRRMECVRGWASCPDYASVNWHEEGAVELSNTLLDSGIGVEAGIWYPEAAEVFRRYRRVGECTRILIEVTTQDIEAAIVDAQRMLGILADLGLPILLHGEGANAWPILQLAMDRGLDSRIGLEDTFSLPDGRTAADNAELVAAALALTRR